jgi:uncharacterized protein (DUF1330 family)
VRGGETRKLEGGYAPMRAVLLEFDSMAAALAWYESDAYAPAKALRQRTAVSDVILMEGAD